MGISDSDVRFSLLRSEAQFWALKGLKEAKKWIKRLILTALIPDKAFPALMGLELLSPGVELRRRNQVGTANPCFPHKTREAINSSSRPHKIPLRQNLHQLKAARASLSHGRI